MYACVCVMTSVALSYDNYSYQLNITQIGSQHGAETVQMFLYAVGDVRLRRPTVIDSVIRVTHWRVLWKEAHCWRWLTMCLQLGQRDGKLVDHMVIIFNVCLVTLDLLCGCCYAGLYYSLHGFIIIIQYMHLAADKSAVSNVGMCYLFVSLSACKMCQKLLKNFYEILWEKHQYH